MLYLNLVHSSEISSNYVSICSHCLGALEGAKLGSGVTALSPPEAILGYLGAVMYDFRVLCCNLLSVPLGPQGALGEGLRSRFWALGEGSGSFRDSRCAGLRMFVSWLKGEAAGKDRYTVIGQTGDAAESGRLGSKQ